MSAVNAAGVLDPTSLESNRHGSLSPVQVRHVYRVGIGSWALNAMFVTAFGGLLTYGVEPVGLRVLVGVITAITSLYMVSRSYDCVLDAQAKRVAAVKGPGRPLGAQATGIPLGGMLRGDQWRQRWAVGGRTLWVPSSASVLLAADDFIIYFAPRSRVVVNVESPNVAAR